MADQETLTAFHDYLRNMKRLSPKTIKDYLGYFKLLDLQKIDQAYIDKFLQDHGNHSNIRGMIKNLLECLGLDMQIRMPPKSTGKKKKRVIRPILQENINSLRSHLYSVSFKHGLIFDLVYQGALRRNEVATIKIRDFEWEEFENSDNNFCKLIILGKGNKERRVLINAETVNKIFAYYHSKYPMKNLDEIKSFYNSNSLLFTRKDGSPITDKTVYYIIKKGSKKILGRDIRPHELRHHRATELEKKGVPIRQIKLYLGHANLTTTEIYLHQSEAEGLRNIERLS